MKNTALIILFGFCLSACVEKESLPPANALDKDTFTAVMIDIQLAEGKNTQKSYIRNRDKTKFVDMYPEIFEKHAVKRENFLATYNYYVEHPGKMEKVYEQVLDSLSKLDVEIKQKYNAERKAENDSLREANQRRRDSLRANQKRK